MTPRTLVKVVLELRVGVEVANLPRAAFGDEVYVRLYVAFPRCSPGVEPTFCRIGTDKGSDG